MSERKVLNKYYPPDFDPSKIVTTEKKTEKKVCHSRMMLPMTIKCNSCSQYMYIGTKFNMKVETLQNEDYLGIEIYRFYFRCKNCYSIITFKTDPKNNGYVCETGGSRTHEIWRDMVLAEEEYKKIKDEEMKEDALKSLEYRTYDSKREMELLNSIEQMRKLKMRESNIDYDELIKKVAERKDDIINIEDKDKEENKGNCNCGKEKDNIKGEGKEIKKEINLDFDNTKDDEGKEGENNGENNKKEYFLLRKKVMREEEENEGEDNYCKEKNNESNKIVKNKLFCDDSKFDDDKDDMKLKKVNDIFKRPKRNNFDLFKNRFKKK